MSRCAPVARKPACPPRRVGSHGWSTPGRLGARLPVQVSTRPLDVRDSRSGATYDAMSAASVDPIHDLAALSAQAPSERAAVALQTNDA